MSCSVLHAILSFYCRIGDRRDAVVSRRQKVKELSSERAAKLQASLAWQQFNRDADEVSIMIITQLKIYATRTCVQKDQSYLIMVTIVQIQQEKCTIKSLHGCTSTHAPPLRKLSLSMHINHTEVETNLVS